MPIALTIVMSVTGLVSTLCGLVLTFRSIKATSPGEALRQWQMETTVKLDNDNRRLRTSNVILSTWRS